ncbi:YhdH/YhfP family quinone oxidoreductase [Filifactor villosus]|uniref:YhdH/YhfP family quinone oxidoreductase n=1 Tax=Filifactor villosus TaxID=29374 RepID=A0ABV9QJ82_9FIRM
MDKDLKFKAMVVREEAEEIAFREEEIGFEALDEGDVVIKVAYSSVNFKDMLAVQKNGGVIRSYPMIPGIDLSGTVVSSKTAEFSQGQEVLVTGYGTGVSHTGGFSQYARVPHEWVIPLPEGLSMREAMVIGTAGLTAGLSVQALEEAGMSAKNKPAVLVTGASGGVGSVALPLLKVQGYEDLKALVRKDYQKTLVQKLGATDIVEPSDVFLKENPLLLKSRYDYILDTVGGEVASHLLPQLNYDGAMSMCGNAGGIKFSTTVLPFILRGNKVLGVDSVQIDREKRLKLWKRFADEWHIMDALEVNEIGPEELPETLVKLKEGRHQGRTVVNMSSW